MIDVACSAKHAACKSVHKYVEKDGTIGYANVGRPGEKAQRVPAPEPDLKSEYEDYIQAAAKRYRIPVNLLRAVMHVGSNFDPHAVSPQGASGLMQMMPATAQDMYVRDIFDIRQNIEGGARYLRLLANLYEGDMVKMLAAYHAGPDAVNKFGGTVPPYEETQSYVRKVIQLYFQYKEQSRLAASGNAAPLEPVPARSTPVVIVPTQPDKTPRSVARLALCREVTKLKIGLTKKGVSKLFGEPTYSRMHTCGGASGVKPWSCEQVTYQCRQNENSTGPSTVSVWYNGDRVNSWQ
jgi:hypothetical protein